MKREKIEEVKTRKYLGTLFNAEGSCDEKIENRIGALSKANGAINKIRSPEEKRTNQEVEMLLYGCETWTVPKWQESRLQATKMRFLRRV